MGKTQINKNLFKITPLIARVVEGKTLNAKQSQKAFETIFKYDTQGYYMLAIISAMHARQETAEELAGLVNANLNLAHKLKLPNMHKSRILNNLTDLSGSGGGSVKTFNVSTTASFIVASAGLYALKNAYWAVTGLTGSADIFDAFGIKVESLNAKTITEMLLAVHISPIYFPLISPKLQNRAKVLKIIFNEQGIKIKTPFHIVSNIISALPVKKRIYGIYSYKYLDTLGQLFMQLGFKHTLTFYGEPGIPEISNVGKTYIVEQRGKNLEKYILVPKELGMKQYETADIRTFSKQENIITFLRVLLNKEHGAKADLAFINAGASLYVTGHAKSIKQGVLKAKELIVSGEAFNVLHNLVAKFGDLNKLDMWIERAG